MKSINELTIVDIRNTFFTRINPKTSEQHDCTLENHYADIQPYSLDTYVPQKVTDQYETARNLYLYAWFEYNFYNIAEFKALTVLELAIKQRVSDSDFRNYCKIRKQKYWEREGKKLSISNGLKGLIEYCRDKQLIRNQDFSAWQRQATMKSYNQAKTAQADWAISKLGRTGQDQISLADINIEKLKPDPNHDYIDILVNTINRVRNEYAHGSNCLYKDVLTTFEMVSEFINQIFQNKEVDNAQ
ncbi:hypothetical protein ACJJIR_03040 [Microbulbifer sp. SSSA008]|uniref:hypothetical protein n=1 Tax=Microbulbifer sp. SSSA008 TaxID=3243380 RepID=UPI004039F97B